MERHHNLGGGAFSGDDSPSDASDASLPFSDTEVEDGMDGARYSYLFNFFGVPFWLIPLCRRDNGFSLFHAKQALLIWGMFFSSLVVGWTLTVVTLKSLWLLVIGGGAALALNVTGYHQALAESAKPLPGLGFPAHAWLRGIQVREDPLDEDPLDKEDREG